MRSRRTASRQTGATPGMACRARPDRLRIRPASEASEPAWGVYVGPNHLVFCPLAQDRLRYRLGRGGNTPRRIPTGGDNGCRPRRHRGPSRAGGRQPSAQRSARSRAARAGIRCRSALDDLRRPAPRLVRMTARDQVDGWRPRHTLGSSTGHCCPHPRREPHRTPKRRRAGLRRLPSGRGSGSGRAPSSAGHPRDPSGSLAARCCNRGAGNCAKPPLPLLLLPAGTVDNAGAAESRGVRSV
jgi:hypothetical protein